MSHGAIKEFAHTVKSHSSCMNAVQYVGLKVQGLSAIYRQLMFGGTMSMQVDGIPFTGQSTLHVGQGGLRNKQVSRTIKYMFRSEIMPSLIKMIPNIDLHFTGKIELHFNEGILTDLKLA